MIKKISKVLLILLPSVFLLLCSCSSDTVFTDSARLRDSIWRLNDTPVFNVPVNDTSNSVEISFTIRTGSDYPFRNIFLFVTTSSPDGISIGDTLQYDLSDEHGIRFGRGFGDIRELELPYKTNVYFPRKGVYEFKIRHGMRIGDLKGVYDIGLRIKEIN